MLHEQCIYVLIIEDQITLYIPFYYRYSFIHNFKRTMSERFLLAGIKPSLYRDAFRHPISFLRIKSVIFH